MSVIFISIFIACSGKGDGDSANDTSMNNQDTNNQDTNNQDINVNENAPIISEADAWCYTQEASGTDTWGFTATASDPQGTDTIESFMPTGISFQSTSGAEVKTIALVCDTSGDCTGSEAVATVGIGCTQASDYQAAFTVEDIQGNSSSVYIAPCREGTGATGK